MRILLLNIVVLIRLKCTFALIHPQTPFLTRVDNLLVLGGSRTKNSQRNLRRFCASKISEENQEVSASEIVEILDQGECYAIINKPGSVKCHHSEWTGKTDEVPMLQRIRDTMNRRVNLIHRLDRGASGCLLIAHAAGECDKLRESTKLLSDALQSPYAIKTYVAITRGEGILKGEDLKMKGWFKVDRAIEDEDGNENSAQTMFNFVSGVTKKDGIRASIVLARPSTGRWHQIRRHLNGLSHPILGDSSHGNSKINRFWRERGLQGERFLLHLARVQLPATNLTPEIDISCPLPDDMMRILKHNIPEVLDEARSILKTEGVIIPDS